MKIFSTLITLVFVHLNIAAQNNGMNFIGNLDYSQIINDVWGYADSNGNEYALVGTNTGTSIVDLSNPNNPQELFFIAGDTTNWRDLKTYDGFAYVTNEEASGLLIIDLTDLPNTIDYKYWKLDSNDLETAHNIFIDENGIAYIFGSNIGNGGALFLDLNFADKFKPPLIGLYDDTYVHDAFVRDDIMYSAEINEGKFAIVNIANKQNPIVIVRQETEKRFTHQCWLSDDDKYLITNDEKAGGYIEIFDISDFANVKRVDKYKTDPQFNVIPHNCFFVGNDYFFTSYYNAGITLVDATKKDNIVEIGSFDTSPTPSSSGFEGCWGAYPYLPSGIILASDRQEGLFVLSADYKRAAYLEGTIIDTINNDIPKSNIVVEIIGTKYIKTSNFDGSYKIGVADSGYYDIRFRHNLCKTKIVSGVKLNTAQVTQLDINLACDLGTNISQIEINEKFTVFPNPFKQNLNIAFDFNDNLKTIEIYNLQGQQVKKIDVNALSGEIDFLNNWQAGHYILNFKFEQHNLQHIIQKTN